MAKDDPSTGGNPLVFEVSDFYIFECQSINIVISELLPWVIFTCFNPKINDSTTNERKVQF